MKNKIVLTLILQCLICFSAICQLKNNLDQEEKFMNMGLGIFVHWSMDSQLGSVISHSMVGASADYLDRYINELPQTFYLMNGLDYLK